MRKGLNTIFIHFFAVVLFALVAAIYFYPALQGKVIRQSDIEQYTGMAKEQNDFRNRTGEEPYWTDGAFGGMPTYQLGAQYPNDYVKKLDRTIRFLPRPADYLFLYLLGFYVLMVSMKADYRLAILGALAFGFSTYLIIILGVGHNAKAHAIGYMPLLLAGIILVFRRTYFWGFVLTAIAMALEVGANHYQMTYYFMLLVLVLGIAYLVDAIRKKKLKHYFISVGLLLGAVVIGTATNAMALMATKEYADWSTRGKSELTINPDGSAKSNTGGLDRSYITQYSYGIAESLDLFVPRLFGGSNSENLGENSKTYDFLIDQKIPKSKALEFTSHLNLYWGDQPGTAGPAYIGAVIFFLFFLGLFLLKGRTKWWLLGGTVMSLVLSWGKNFSALTDFMIDYFPLYDKFRAVSSIQVILELCTPIMAALALNAIIKGYFANKTEMKALRNATIVVMGLGLALFLFKGMFSFTGINDDILKRYYGQEILTLIQLDRKAVYTSDLIRSLILVAVAAGLIWFYIKDRLRTNVFLGGLVIVLLVDLVGVDRRYVNNDSFVSRRAMEKPFEETATDRAILQDTTDFRVYDPYEGLNGARTSYFHKSIGGYHAAKPAAMQDLFDFYIYNNDIGVLNLLNVKYIVQRDEQGEEYPALNPDAYGSAWFVNEIKSVGSANEEITALRDLDGQQTAVVDTARFPLTGPASFATDSTAAIDLVKYSPNHLTYRSRNDNLGLAVFSEMYYPHGWAAYIDGEPRPFFKADYALRAMYVPSGTHTIEFKFTPDVVYKGRKIAMAGSILIGLLIIGGLAYTFLGKRSRPEKSAAS